MLVEAIVTDFLRYHAEQSSAATCRFYKQGLAWLSRGFEGQAWESLERLAVKDALFASYHWPDGKAMAAATHRRNKVAFAQLQKYAIDQEFTAKTILTEKDLKKPGAGRQEVIPTAEDLDQIIAAASPAMALAIRGLRACGMRPGELCRADIEMIVIESGVRAIVLTEHKTAKKTGRARVIAIGKQLGGGDSGCRVKTGWDFSKIFPESA